ncbi:hypothetical protein [Parasitella parasitica]|uniref:DUF6570 domain-containing protein n=1 Tax=Parasitella parasitica TaxID=35722 RepID=A0A0B7MUW1_9FUNG|nr:hypothetical protein [Parasitella parasitica]
MVRPRRYTTEEARQRRSQRNRQSINENRQAENLTENEAERQSNRRARNAAYQRAHRERRRIQIEAAANGNEEESMSEAGDIDTERRRRNAEYQRAYRQRQRARIEEGADSFTAPEASRIEAGDIDAGDPSPEWEILSLKTSCLNGDAHNLLRTSNLSPQMKANGCNLQDYFATLCLEHGLRFPDPVPELMALTKLEERSVAPRHVFQSIWTLQGAYGQYRSKGGIVNVPVSVDTTVQSIPRWLDDTNIIPVVLTRRMRYNGGYIKGNISTQKNKLLSISRKRQSFHFSLHLQENAEVVKELTKLTAIKPKDKIDRLFMGADDELDMLSLTRAIKNWMENAHHVKELHKKDLLYYHIMDFVTSDNSTGVCNILKGKYSLAKHYCSSFQNDLEREIKENCDNVERYAMSVLGSRDKSFRELIKTAQKARRSSKNKTRYQKCCLRILSLFKNIDLLNEDMNENEYSMCFIYTLLRNLFKYSKEDIVIRWGEAKLQANKLEEHSPLDDNHRRSPGPNIDFIFKTKQHGKVELAVGEISGAPNAQSQEHYLGDRNKIAKNLKSMLKYIISLKSELHEESSSKIQVYGIQIYKLRVRVYRLMYQHGNYIFMQNYLTESHDSIVRYLSSSSDEIQTTSSTLSSPYVSPQKRQKANQDGLFIWIQSLYMMEHRKERIMTEYTATNVGICRVLKNRPFWKRRGLKLPGSVVPSHSTTEKDDKPSKTDVIGARYTYNSLVTFHDASLKPVMHSSTAAQQQQQIGSKSMDKHSQKKNHARSTSTQKSFNAFLKDTNDEWSDDIHEPRKQPREATADTSTHQAAAAAGAALEKASKAVEAVLAATPMPANPPPQPTRKNKSTNPNGIKDHVQDILLGAHSIA